MKSLGLLAVLSLSVVAFAGGSYVAEVDASDPARCAVYTAFQGASVIFIR